MSQDPTRIVRIVAQLNISGPARQAILLTAALDALPDSPYDCYLVAGLQDENDSLVGLAEEKHITPILLDELVYDNPLKAIPALWRVYRLLKDIQPTIVHTHNTRAGFLGRVAARLAGVPIVVHTLHEYPFRGYYNRFSTVIFIYMERLGSTLSDSIVTLSQGLRKALVETYGITRRSRITVLPLGFDLEHFAETPRKQGIFRQRWSIAEDVPLVGIIGRLLPVKNHALFLQAAQHIRTEIPTAHFVIVGDGEFAMRSALEQQAMALGLEGAITFTGWQQDMHHIYSDLDVLVNSSLNEGTPVPIMEALAAGCPVVATDVGGVADLLGNGNLGALVPSGDTDALAQAIISILQQPPDGQAAQEAMIRRYGISRLAQDVDSLYRGLLAKKGLPHEQDMASTPPS
ncbi:MAG: glycosyltransferase family 4 protein [Chloroflexota bacterium]